MSAAEEAANLSQSSPTTNFSESPESRNPRSAIRHRPIKKSDSDRTTKVLPRVPRASRSKDAPDTEQKNTAAVTPRPATSVAGTTFTRPHWLVILGLGMLLALLAVVIAQAASGWFTTAWDDQHYGRPRTFQTDASVGHESGNTPSHFIVLNLHGRIEVVELSGGDPAHAHIYPGPQLVGPNADLIPATVTFIDTHHDHHPDMLLQAGSIQIIFHNQQGTFVPA